MKIKDPKITVKQSLELADDNQAKLARILNVSRMAVTVWKQNGKYLPALWAYRIREHFSIDGRPPVKEIIKDWDKKEGDAK